MIPHARGIGLGERDHSALRHVAANQLQRSACPGSGEADQASRMGNYVAESHAGLSEAPSGTSPRLTYFQSATSSLRAKATIVILRFRPPSSRTRSANQRLSAEPGWLRSQSQASSTIAVRKRGLPDFEMPCSLWMRPLSQGVGASPA
jgi:hypothetical protein